MDNEQNEARFFELEKRVLYLEKFVDELNSVVVEQQQVLDAFKKELLRLKKREEQDSPVGDDHPAIERPPHY